jgi:HEAT repeat protein
MIAYRALIIVVGSILGIFLALALWIIANKMIRDLWAYYCRKRRAVLEPIILKYINWEEGNLKDYLSGALKPFDRRVVEEILVTNALIVRGGAKEKLTKAFEDFGFIDLYLKGLRSTRWWKRAESAENLGIAGSRRAILPLADKIKDPVLEVRVRAAKALGQMKGTAAVKPLIGALSEPSRWSAIRIADILSNMGKQVVDELMECFEECPVHARIAAVDILGRIKSLDTLPFLIKKLSDENKDIRARAAHALGMIGDPSSCQSLIGALQDGEWPVRAMAAKALGRIKAPEGIEPLCQVLGDPEWWVRANAAEALKNMGERGIQKLFDMLDSPDKYAGQQAVLMLQESGHIDSYMEKLVSQNDVEKLAALELFKKIVGMGRTDLIDETSQKHPNPEVRKVLSELLHSGAKKGEGKR